MTLADTPAPPAAAVPPTQPPAAPSVAPVCWRSATLFQGRSLIDIQHGDAVYRLRITAQDKLILTK